jgi:hypothetical protein
MRRRGTLALALALAVAMLVLGARGARGAGWGTSDYVAAGVPDLARPWSTAEIRKAVDAITRASAGHPERLPRHRSASSGAVFAKLLELPPQDRTASVDAQVVAHFERYRALADAGDLYGAVARQAMPREWIELYGAVLHEAVALEQLSGPFIAALAPGDSRLPERRAMVAKLHASTGKMLMLQLVVAIGDNVAVAERIAALHNLTDTAPAMLAVIEPRFAHALRNDVKTLAGATRGDLHDAAVRLQRAIAGAP